MTRSMIGNVQPEKNEYLSTAVVYREQIQEVENDKEMMMQQAPQSYFPVIPATRFPRG